ncbi:hypothetical protein Glove_255g18 [Diversispora epigaea]|uniref:Protein kinase domain-containing protein n=1 Tax=Diversispora epigaea TaxID=1348612 RepID=A0A397IEE5_9GLOM|nr:hypothetical protein Glove_255g18 [Diversispora epigaea]
MWNRIILEIVIGIGTTMNRKHFRDNEKAFQRYLKSAEGGNYKGQNMLGYCYQNGIGTIKDEGKPFHWFLKSAEWGNHRGQISIEYFYRNEISHMLKKKQNKLVNRCINCENLNQLNNSNSTCLDCKLQNGLVIIVNWKAEWIDMPEELTANFQCRDKYVFGYNSRFDDKEFAIVLRYMKNGNLRDFLTKINHYFGLNDYEHTASDIYSVGIIMWVISTGKIPFGNRAYGSELAFQIIDGLHLMKKCWHKDPAKQENEDEDSSSTETTHSEERLTSKPLPPLSLQDLNINTIEDKEMEI